MPEGPDGKTIIIVKKVVGHGGHHGGAWKVAYADFVTAMMALFMVLWLVNTASVTTREAIATYFKRPGIFEKGSGTPLEIGGGGILNDTFAPPADGDSQIIPNKNIYGVEEGEEIQPKLAKENAPKGEGEGDEAIEQLASELQQSVESNRAAVEGFLGDVGIKVDQRGLHLEIMDTPTASMFASASADILPEARQTLTKIAKVLTKLPNPIDIEGHTDATPFRADISDHYDNWNLASDRANAARRALEELGVDHRQIARIVGYADKRPKVPDNPADPSNRRITISMRHTEQAAASLAGTPVRETQPRPVLPLKTTPKTVTNVDEIAKEVSKVLTPEPTLKPEAVVPPIDAARSTAKQATTRVEPVQPKIVDPITEDLKPIQSGPVESDGAKLVAPPPPTSEPQKTELPSETLPPPVAEVITPNAGNQLKVEVQTTVPEEQQAIEGNEQVEVPGPAWIEQDKIFGGQDPFAQ